MCPVLRLSVFFACLFSVTTVGADDAADLLKVILSNETSNVDRANAFEKIGDIAGDDAIEPLTRFLSDKKWSHYARFALQKMEGESVDKALFESLDALEGDLKLGVIDSIGRRGDPDSVPRLAKLLASGDAKSAAAAAVALGSIGTTDAAAVLTKALRSEKNTDRRASLASSLLLVGQGLAKSGNKQAATDLFDTLRNVELPKAYRIGATHNAILVRGAQGVDLLVEQLKSLDRDFFQTGLAVARILPGEAATKAVVESMNAESEPDRQALLILALKDRGDNQARDAIIEKLRSDSLPVQMAAIDAMGALGDEFSVPNLLSVANAENAEAVVASLVALKGTRVNAALIKAAEPPNTSTIPVQALGQRRAKEAASRLLELSTSDSEAISRAAIVALGMTASQDRFQDLLALMKSAKNDDRKAAIQSAIRETVFRSTQPDACAEALGAIIPNSRGANREFLFEQLRIAGGKKAVDLMRQFATGADESLQDAATKTLGRWLSADAAPILLQVAKGDGKFANRALGGYIRIFRQFEMPDSERVAMAEKAFNVATRSNERNAAIDALSRFPCVGSFELALKQLDAPGSEAKAAAAVLTIGRTVMDLDPETGKAGLKKLIDADISERITSSAKALLK